MEVLAGARDEAHLDQLRRLLGRCAHMEAAPVLGKLPIIPEKQHAV